MFGDTLARVGEGSGTSRSNPEVIAPLDKLKQFIGGGTQFPEYLPMHRIEGSDLLLLYARANKQGGRRS